MTQPLFNVRRRKVGGIWFLRIGRFQFTFCLCRPSHAHRNACEDNFTRAMLDGRGHAAELWARAEYRALYPER